MVKLASFSSSQSSLLSGSGLEVGDQPLVYPGGPPHLSIARVQTRGRWGGAGGASRLPRSAQLPLRVYYSLSVRTLGWYLPTSMTPPHTHTHARAAVCGYPWFTYHGHRIRTRPHLPTSLPDFSFHHPQKNGTCPHPPRGGMEVAVLCEVAHGAIYEQHAF